MTQTVAGRPEGRPAAGRRDLFAITECLQLFLGLGRHLVETVFRADVTGQDLVEDRGGRLDHLTVEQLSSVRKSTRDAGLLLALAGRVSIVDLPGVAAIGPDLVAVRSAACRDGRRELAVETSRVRELVGCLEGTSGPVAEWRNAG